MRVLLYEYYTHKIRSKELAKQSKQIDQIVDNLQGHETIRGCKLGDSETELETFKQSVIDLISATKAFSSVKKDVQTKAADILVAKVIESGKKREDYRADR